MSMFVHMFKTADARYAIGAIVSWPVYSALYIAMLKVFDRYYAFASAISWMLSYAIVYAFQKYGTFGAMGRKALLRSLLRQSPQLSSHGSLRRAYCALVACDFGLGGQAAGRKH